MWADGASEEDTAPADSPAHQKEYIEMMKTMRQLGVTGLNLDLRNLKAYPATVKLWHQLQAYPQEVVPLMDQAIKDIMVEQATQEMNELRSQQQHKSQARTRARDSSSMPRIPSSEANDPEPQGEATSNTPADIPDIIADVESRTYKVRPFGLDQSINLRELNPAGKVSISGVIDSC